MREAEADLYPVGVAGRVEVLPVQWRRILDLRVDEVARGLIPPGLAALRQVGRQEGGRGARRRRLSGRVCREATHLWCDGRASFC